MRRGLSCRLEGILCTGQECLVDRRILTGVAPPWLRYQCFGFSKWTAETARVKALMETFLWRDERYKR